MVKVCVLFGGCNSEHEVSLRSAASVLRNIPREQYSVSTLGITKDGKWYYYTGEPEAIEDGSWLHSDAVCPAVFSPDRGAPGILVLRPEGVEHIAVDVVFPVLHGKNGEDGTVQGLLELARLPYVGCGVLSSAVCMDKSVAHDLLTAAGVPKTKLITLTKENMEDIQGLTERLEFALGYPMFVKPANAGSSVGVTKVTKLTDIVPALEAAFVHDWKVVVEQAVVGQEIECAVMGNMNPIASDVLGEIVPTTDFYDYNAKYLDDSAGLLVPANLQDPAVMQAVRLTAIKAYRALDCRGLARVDFFVRKDGSVVLNEINTLPGFTSISMFPKLFEASGVAYPEIVHRLIQYALEESKRH